MMFFDILTLFPEMFKGPLTESIIKRAQKKNIIDIRTVNIRDFTEDKHNTTDEPPYGGGAGMVLKPQPIYKAWQSVREKRKTKAKTILMSPQGKKLDQNMVRELSQNDGLILICGRYEGVDERIRETIVDEEISIGDFVLTGGELPAMVLIDAVSRMVDGVLGDENSSIKDSFYKGLLEHPQYTRPREFRGLQVPDVLLSGNHKLIDNWRKRESLKRTLIRRPDLLENKKLSSEEIEIIEELKKELKGEINENN
ncbi:MAG: tRNA (guanosine(37)-N1)-methyltransferase TrmD [Bacillota bacterium]